MSTAATIAQRHNAKGPKRNGWWQSCCPFHDDENPSFGFTEEGFKCQGCGEHGHINTLAEHLGIEVQSTNGRGAQLTADDADRLLHNRGLRAGTIQRFRIESDVQRQAWRFPMGNGRAFKLKRFDGEKPKCKWDPPGSSGGAEVYGLPGALKIDPDDVLLVEGEPDVWICQQAGLPAVSFTAGAETVPGAGVTKLVQAGVQRVRVVYDLDEAGKKGCPKAASALQAAGLEVETLKMPDRFPPGSDLTDLYNELGRDDAVFRDAVANLAAFSAVDAWPDAPDLPGSPDPDPLPLDALPSVLRDMASTISGSTQAPLDSAIGVVLGGVSVALVGKAQVEIRADTGWIKPAHTYVGIEQPSGTGKSPLINFVYAPIARWEAERAELERPKRRLADEQVLLAEARLVAARKQAVTDGDAKPVEKALKELSDAEGAARGGFQLLISDATEEEVVRVLARNGGRAASIDAEGTLLEVAAGRYGNGDARLAALTHGWDGEAMRQNRVTRARVDVPSANLALLLGLQPGILSGMVNAETMKQRGVLARFIWIAPRIRWDDMLVGTDVPALDRHAVARYEKVLLDILNKSDKSEGDPYLLKMSPEAQKGIYRLEQAKIDGMRPGGRLESVPAFAGKLPDHGARIAALLTVADRADKGEDLFRDAIPGLAMEAAERLIAAISTHVVKVIGDAGGDRKMLDLAYLLDLCITMTGSTESEIRERARGRKVFRDAEHAHDRFDDLERRGCIRRVPQARTSRAGRDPSPLIEVHPTLGGSDLSDLSEQSAPETQRGNKSDKSEGPEDSHDNPDLAVEPEELDEEDRRYIEDERAGMQAEEAGTTTHIADSLLAGEAV